MAWHPRAVKKPIPRYAEGVRPRMSAHNRVIFHTAVTNSDSLFGMMSVPGTATSHFYVRADGTIEQYASTDVQSSANLEGNHDCITVETWDGYGASWNGNGPGPKWTKAQVEALADIAAWAHKVHGVPLQRLANSRPGTRGIGWHRQGCDGNFPGGILRGRVPGGERWSYSFGKVCPTDTRIKQVPGIIKRAKRGGKKRPFVNRRRINRALRNPGHKRGKLVMRQLARLDKALDQHGFPAVGWPPHIHSLHRAVGKFQKSQGWSGKDADGYLGKTTCRLLGLRSKWSPLPSWRRVRPFSKSVSKSTK